MHKNLLLWPKRRALRRLGPFSSSPTSLSPSFVVDYTCSRYTLVGIYKTRRSIKKTHQWPKRRALRRLGPFSLSPTSLSPSFVVDYTCSRYTLVGIYKTRRSKKKLTNGPNDAHCAVWARSRHLRPPCLRPS